jgi:hypothetical protein
MARVPSTSVLRAERGAGAPALADVLVFPGERSMRALTMSGQER